MPKKIWRPFRYNNVYIVRVVDGDTVEADIDMGFGFTFNTRFRLLVVNTPEKKDRAAWQAAKDFTQAWCDEHAGFIEIETMEKDGFGRWLALFRCQIDGNYLQDAILEAGHSPENYRGQSMDDYRRSPTMLAENMHTPELQAAVKLQNSGYLKRRSDIRARQVARKKKS